MIWDMETLEFYGKTSMPGQTTVVNHGNQHPIWINWLHKVFSFGNNIALHRSVPPPADLFSRGLVRDMPMYATTSSTKNWKIITRWLLFSKQPVIQLPHLASGASRAKRIIHHIGQHIRTNVDLIIITDISGIKTDMNITQKKEFMMDIKRYMRITQTLSTNWTNAIRLIYGLLRQRSGLLSKNKEKKRKNHSSFIWLTIHPMPCLNYLPRLILKVAD